jgi:hypothetical protein
MPFVPAVNQGDPIGRISKNHWDRFLLGVP